MRGVNGRCERFTRREDDVGMHERCEWEMCTHIRREEDLAANECSPRLCRQKSKYWTSVIGTSTELVLLGQVLS